ncbi:ABC transporter permease subunit [Bacillus sp. NEB1478]|uniref:ABC transporter permease n=1 Tax=Bacillus sp. NEB1478 TaxID=3073816 RepID=UPI0028738279|nr:ABC transporter permease subunit [Bacillus sp. NEB1478]WNB91915.1 ABC transporter permease subunit [Bacillus sp. NEB1478]
MIRNIWKEPFFIIGFLFVAGILLFSFYHQFIMDNKIYEDQYMYNAEGTPFDKAPFEPSSKYWFGSDRMGVDLFFQLVSGAKYTLGIAFLASLLRVALSFFGGILLVWLGRTISIIKGLSQSFYYVPAALLIFFIVGPIMKAEVITFWEKVFFEMFFIVLIAVPNTAILIKEEISLIEREEFITSAKLIGSSRLRILWKHIMPHLWPKLILIYVQQVIAVLLLLAHLGILQIFIGGTTMREFAMEFMIPASNSNEWSGLLGTYYYQLKLAPWLVFFPVMSFALVILAFNFMAEGLKRATYQITGRKRGKRIEKNNKQPLPSHVSFTFISDQRTG